MEVLIILGLAVACLVHRSQIHDLRQQVQNLQSQLMRILTLLPADTAQKI